MKILAAITELGAGGAEKILAVLTQGLIRRGHEVVVLSLSPLEKNRTIPDRLNELGARIICLNEGKKPVRLVSGIRKVILAEKPDLIHTHLIHTNILTRIANFHTGIPLINTIHIAERRAGKGLFFLLDKLTFPLCDCMYAVSNAAARFHETKCHMKPFSIETVYNAVDQVIPAEPELCRRLKSEWGLADTDKLLGSIGRLDWQKGYDLLLTRLDKLSRQIPAGETWGLVLIGEGPESDRLKSLAEKARRNNLKIVLPGFRPDAASLMTMFDVFLMPSRYEGYGLALAEAMTLGLPVVCSTADSLPELCQLYHGSSFLVEMDNDADGSMLALQILQAVKAGHGPGHVLVSSEDMVSACLKLYEKARTQNQ